MQLGVRGGARWGEEGETWLGWVRGCFFQSLSDKVCWPFLVRASGEAAPGREGKEQAGAAPAGDAAAEEGARARDKRGGGSRPPPWPGW